MMKQEKDKESPKDGTSQEGNMAAKSDPESPTVVAVLTEKGIEIRSSSEPLKEIPSNMSLKEFLSRLHHENGTLLLIGEKVFLAGQTNRIALLPNTAQVKDMVPGGFLAKDIWYLYGKPRSARVNAGGPRRGRTQKGHEEFTQRDIHQESYPGRFVNR